MSDNSAHFMVSVPGRTEFAGNHQDHQGGCVIAAAIDKRIFCGVHVRPENVIEVISAGHDSFSIDLDDPNWWIPQPEERQSSIALVRGMAAQLLKSGVDLKGCTLEIASDIPSGSGLSSSAAFELCIGAAILAAAGWGIADGVSSSSEAEYAGKLSRLQLAQMALHAERAFFGKPCGIMDQIACAFGGVVHLDFQNRLEPVVTLLHMPASFDEYAYYLVNCGNSHDDLTDEFASVAQDMQTAADAFGVPQLRDITMQDYLSNLEQIRSTYGDLVALRGLAFFEEFDLVERRLAALESGNMAELVDLSNHSGMVSAEQLQNVGVPGINEGAMVALALCHVVIEQVTSHATTNKDGSARIHGGGFGGTIQVMIPKSSAEVFEQRIEEHLGAGACMKVALGAPGISIEPSV